MRDLARWTMGLGALLFVSAAGAQEADSVAALPGTWVPAMADPAGPATTGVDSSSAPDFLNAAGATAGIPQLFGLTWETEPVFPFRLQANVGTILAISSINARALLVPSRWPVQPYVFGGGGILFGFEIEGFDGFDSYLWVGYGARVRIARVLIFGEMSFFQGSEEFSGPGVGGGVLWSY